jgi:hypothetical protein
MHQHRPERGRDLTRCLQLGAPRYRIAAASFRKVPRTGFAAAQDDILCEERRKMVRTPAATLGLVRRIPQAASQCQSRSSAK